MNFMTAFFVVSGLQFFRYFALAGMGWLAFWSWNNPLTARKRIQKIDFKKEDLKREFGYSILSALIFGFFLTIAFLQDLQNGLSLAHSNPNTSWISDLGWIAFLILVQDAYFYWMHRWIHKPSLFRRVHRVHHLSKNPSPWASLAFHPLEAVLEVIWVLPVKFLFPIPLHVWMVFAVIIIGINVIGHLGVELYPESWLRNPVLKYLNRSTQHNRHHQFVTGNYGLYFTFWDRWMGTLRKD